MAKTLKRVGFVLLWIPALLAGLAWLQSHFAGYQRVWSNPETEVCGRFMSKRGRMLLQYCNLHPSRINPMDPTIDWPVVMPPDYTVGSNPKGETWTVIKCGPHNIPFCDPSRGLIFDAISRIHLISNQATQTKWRASWSEYACCYWLVMLVMLIVPVVATIDLIWKRFLPDEMFVERKFLGL